jgi:uncharacterized damage-inducible protein DinB
MTVASRNGLAAPVDKIYLTNEMMLRKALDGLTLGQLFFRPTEINNPMLWIAGHIVQTRTSILKLMGEEFDTGWGGLFTRGCVLKDAASYPTISEILATLDSLSARLHARLTSLSDEQLSSPAVGPKFPNSDTLLEQVGFLAWHESYHVGQLAYIRKSLGFAGIGG